MNGYWSSIEDPLRVKRISGAVFIHTNGSLHCISYNDDLGRDCDPGSSRCDVVLSGVLREVDSIHWEDGETWRKRYGFP